MPFANDSTVAPMSAAPAAPDLTAPIGHAVQFYESDWFLVESVARFVAAGLELGDVAIVIATPDHRDALEARLTARRIDVYNARSERRYIALDAAETLSKFMVADWPDAARFDETVGALVAEAVATGCSRVRAFGEMVALLRADGKPDAAIRLEQLWNELARTLPFSLLCAYPMHAFSRTEDETPLLKICAEHSGVIPTETYTTLDAPEERLRVVAHLQQQARVLGHEQAARESAEAALRRRDAEMDDFFENAAMALHWVGPDGTILRANRAELDLLGYAREEYVGRRIGEFHADQPVLDDILRRLRAGETIHDYEARLRCKDGSIKHVLIDSNVRWESGAFQYTRCFTRDITDRKRAEAEREKLLRATQAARAETEAASRAKDEFLSVVSHELRTPLASMLGWVSVLKTGVTGERAARALETIERSGRVQAKLIEDLLDVSRVVTGKMRLDLKLTELPAIVRQAVDTILPTADAKGIRLEAHLDPTAGPVAGDADRLQQIAWNLLSNAVKFTPPGGRVEVRLERREENVCLVVRDTGRGIAREFLPCVFERFRQAESATSRRTGGLGLGLAIVRHLTELHGGSVAVASDGEGHGATFTVTLPLTPQQGDVGRNGHSPRLLEGIRVLVVDDEFESQDSLRGLLEAHGARVSVAGTAKEAEEVVRQNPPDAIVSDIRMPGKDGYSFIRDLRGSGHRVPAIAVTGTGATEDAGRAVAEGYHVRLDKPIQPDRLIETLAELAAATTGR